MQSPASQGGNLWDNSKALAAILLPRKCGDISPGSCHHETAKTKPLTAHVSHGKNEPLFINAAVNWLFCSLQPTYS